MSYAEVMRINDIVSVLAGMGLALSVAEILWKARA
jgi:hypothetical protein